MHTQRAPIGRRGFTLIELMTVIAIIGILASIITVSLVSARAKGRDAKRVADIRTIQLSLEEYYSDNGNYPATLSAIAPTYISSVPTDPNSSSASPVNYFYSAYNASGSANCISNKPVRYHLAAVMESTAATNAALAQDADWPGAGASTMCTGSSADFNGLTTACTSGSSVAASADGCYDQTN